MNNPLPTELEALAEQLDRAWGRRYGTPKRRAVWRSPLAPRLAFASLALAALIAVVLTRTSGPGAVKQALAAVGTSPAAAIVHFTSISRDASGAVTQRTEMWAATSQPYAERSILSGDGSAPVEQSASGNSVSQYDSAADTTYVRTRAGGIAEGNHPADFAPNANDVKAELRSADAQDDGTVTVAGATLHRFTLSPTGGGTCTYDVEPDTYYAVNFSCTNLPSGSIDEHWQYLPRADNEDLLSVRAQHPTSQLNSGPMESCGLERHTAATPPCIVNAPGG